ncbi:hypothetical protein FQN52_005773 [Onygenales sp. PD_12]|nr:hypothetical protein FQN52_005773 [Onygenales sp. PD_12]
MGHALQITAALIHGCLISWACFIIPLIWVRRGMKKRQFYPRTFQSIFECNESALETHGLANRILETHGLANRIPWSHLLVIFLHALCWSGESAILVFSTDTTTWETVFYNIIIWLHQILVGKYAYELHDRRQELRAMPKVFMCRLCDGRTGVRDCDRVKAAQGPNPYVAKAINEDFMKDFPEAMTTEGYMDMRKATELFLQGRKVKHAAGGLCNMHFDEVAGPKMRDVRCEKLEKLAWLKTWFMDEKAAMDIMDGVEERLEGDEALQQGTEKV